MTCETRLYVNYYKLNLVLALWCVQVRLMDRRSLLELSTCHAHRYDLHRDVAHPADLHPVGGILLLALVAEGELQQSEQLYCMTLCCS